MALTAEQYKAYLQGLAKEKGFDAGKTEKLTALIEGEGDITLTRAELKDLIQPIVEHPLARHADYARAMDGLSTKEKTLNEWYEKKAKPAWEQMQQATTAAQAKIKKYEDRYGDLDEAEDIGGGKARTATGDIVDIKKVTDLVSERENGLARQFLTFQLDQNRIQREHFAKFKEVPDLAKLMAVVSERSTPEKPITLDDAYAEVYGEQVQAYSKEAEEKRIDAIVNDRLKAERARKAAPVNGAAVAETGTFFAQHADSQKSDAKPMSDAEREALFNADLETELAKINQPAAQ